MLVEMAVGDSYGAAFEYAPPEFVRANNDPTKGYSVHPIHKREAGQYTDDTQMSLALAEFLLDAYRAPGGPDSRLTTARLAHYFVNGFKRNPREGYASRFYALLKSVRNGVDFLRLVQPHSDKSGGAMRAAACGFMKELSTAIDRAMWQASLTHATRAGMTAAAAVAAGVWFCRTGMPLECLSDSLENHFPGWQLIEPWVGKVGSAGIYAVRAAITAIANNATMPASPSMTAILRDAVDFTGDVDTVAAIALGMVATSPFVVRDLPPVLYGGLENGKFGRDYLMEVDLLLEATFPMPDKKGT